jgi:hypothetical protein
MVLLAFLLLLLNMMLLAVLLLLAFLLLTAFLLLLASLLTRCPYFSCWLYILDCQLSQLYLPCRDYEFGYRSTWRHASVHVFTVHSCQDVEISAADLKKEAG